MQRIMIGVLLHVHRMPMGGMCHRKHEIKHWRSRGTICLRLLDCISVLLKHARAISKRIPDWCIEVCDNRLEEGTSGRGNR